MCHLVPITASVVTTTLWFKTRDPRIGQLNTLFYGASLFGIVDHLWHGEFFMFSGNLAKDLMLGVTITLVVLAAWAAGLAWQWFSRKPVLAA
jgi:hypothetical protein